MTTPTGLEPTQTRRPWRATLRTVLAVGIPALLLLPTVFEILVDELGGTLPPQVTQYLVLIGAFVTALAAVITRILALPQVEALLRRLPAAAFAAQPRPKPDEHQPILGKAFTGGTFSTDADPDARHRRDERGALAIAPELLIIAACALVAVALFL